MMTKVSDYIYNSLLRWVICLAALTTLTLNIKAQTPWDGGVSAPSLKTSGATNSKENPYQISNAKELAYISNNIGSFQTAFLELTDDIDLGGEQGQKWVPIGSRKNGFFIGEIEGNGHVIKNMLIDWAKETKNTTRWQADNSNNETIGIGLFAAFGGIARNIIIENAKITDIETNNSVYRSLKTGIFTGVLSQKGTPDANYNNGRGIIVENVIVRSSKIEAGNTSSTMRSYIIGGLIGDINGQEFDGSAEIKTKITINNVYVGVDIDFGETERTGVATGQATQYNIGGIFGRMRRGNTTQMPSNAVFSGKIKAPWASIGPIFSMARSNGGSAAGDFFQAYAGEFMNGQVLSGDENHYYDFKIFNYLTGEYEQVTNSHPSCMNNVKSTDYGNRITRTFVEQDATTFKYTDKESMRQLKGVNHGEYIEDLVEFFYEYNTNNYDDLDNLWTYNKTTKTASFIAKPGRPQQTITVREAGQNQFSAEAPEASSSSTYIWYFTKGNKQTYITTTTTPTLTSLLPNYAEKIVVYLADSANKKVVENNQYIKAECEINERTNAKLDFDIEAPDQLHTVIKPKVVVNEEVQTGYTFDIVLESNDGSHKYVFENQTGDVTLLPVACDVMVTVRAKQAGIEGFLETLPKALGRYIDLSQVEITSKPGTSTTIWSYGHEFRYPELKYNSGETAIIQDKDEHCKWFITRAKGGTEEFAFNQNETKEWIDDSGFHIIISDLISFDRWVRFKYTDHYGFTSITPFDKSKQVYKISKATIDNTVKDNPLRFRIQFVYGSNNNGIIDDSTTDDYTFKIKGPRDADFKDFTIDEHRYFDIDAEDYTFGNQWVIRVWDGYGEQMNDFTLTLDANLSVGMDIEGRKLVPMYCATNPVWPNAKPRSEVNVLTDDIVTAADITYEWTIVYKDEDGTEVKSVTSTDNTLGDFEPYDFEITVTAKDRNGTTRTAEYKADYMSQTLEMNVEQTSEIPVIYTAIITASHGLSINPNSGTWQWYGVNGEISDNLNDYYILDGQTTNKLLINTTNNNYTAYCIVYTASDGRKFINYATKKDIVYVYNRTSTAAFKDGAEIADGGKHKTIYETYPDGNDSNLGRTPNTAVKTMKRAYELLTESNKATDNVIVVMGYLDDNNYLHVKNKDAYTHDYDRNATITGSYGEIDNGVIKMVSNGAYGNDDINGLHALGGATIFKNITFYGYKEDGASKGQLFLYCHLHDLTIDNGVKIEAYQNYAANKSGIYDSPAPFITIVGGMHNYDGLLVYPKGNAVPGKTTINILSGCFGRIIASARNDGNYNTISHNIFGDPDNPHRVEVNIAIKHASEAGLNEYTPDKDATNQYKYDIGLLTGGQTDGSIYVDSKQNMISGKVGRFISGNISYGRKTYKEGEQKFPSDGFYGSSVLNLEGGEIGELVGGTLGRHDCSTGPTELCEAYFYGRSILNINAGIINNNIYGAGAGGVSGIGDDKYHTKDETIPYYDSGTLKYGDYAHAKNKMPTITLLNEDAKLKVGTDGKRNVLDLTNTYCEVNINGGTIYGDVFGGGYGYSAQVAVDKALDQAGDLFGQSYVNINGGTIKGHIYGGGAGADNYYNTASDEKKNNFIELANLYGDTHVVVKGGIIEGRIFAGSKGIAGLSEMATLYGNTNLKIENVEMSDNTTSIPIINGNIYGGSEIGKITGNTNVQINGGAIGNCIFGGSEGIEADVKDNKGNVTQKQTTAYIGGSTNVNVQGGTYFTEDYIGKISTDNKLQLTPATRTFNIYGGGYRNCIVEGNTKVEIGKSLFTSHRCLLEGRTFQECAADETYRKFSVYAAGRGILTDVFGNATLDINLVGGASVPSSKPVDVANNQQFFMICGGGFAGNVYGNTNVTLNGNIFARSIYGGGMYGRVEGTANLTVNGGSYYNIYGGGLLGDIMKGANLSIGVKASADNAMQTADKNRNIYIYENVYGGNDVGGIVGYERTQDSNGNPIVWRDGIDSDNDGVRDGEPLPVRVLYKDAVTGKLEETNLEFTLHSSSDDYGVNMRINGGTILGNVFGAGNGNHTGYYVPNKAESEHHSPGEITRMKYHEGPAYLYRFNSNDMRMAGKSMLDENEKIGWGLYEYRPRVRRVRLHIGGNSATDRVKINGSVYGGGHACTIGRINPQKDVLKDPSRFEGGGTLKMNFGSHVTVKDGVYMGSLGDIIGKQQAIEEDKIYEETTLNSDYYYHYYDATTETYKLGFPNSIDGRKRFHAYLKLIDMDAKTQLTFYDDPTATEMKSGEILPDHKPYNPATFDAKDLRWGSFFAGGARGSMTYEPTNKSDIAYEYTLPHGLTVETRVVGGSEDAQVVYYDYADNYKTIDTTKPIFTYDGGIVYNTNDGVNTFGGGVVLWDNAPEGTDAKELQIGNNTPRGTRKVMKLTVNCDFDPQMSTYVDEFNETHEIRYGGLVYGGCFNSGITNGSVEVICTNNLLGSYYESQDYHDYLTWSTLRHNIGRVYGGGFGENSSIWGETHVTLSDNFRGFNVFGGGMKGHVTYGTHVTVKGLAKVYNAVYGGGMRGNVGYDPLTKAETVDNTGKTLAIGTHVNLISGGIDRVYGGAFMSNVYGGTHITISDEGQPEGTPRLLIGSVFGGNDVTGNIYEDKTSNLCTDIRVAEEPRTDKKNYILAHESETQKGKYYGGYPLVGNIYGAGNGNMGDYIPGVTIDRDEECYNGGSIHIANGDKANIDIWDLGELKYKLPNVDNSRITVNGGTIVNVYGGGSMCTSKVSDNIIVNYTDTVARAAVPTANQDPLTWGVLRLFQDLQQQEVTTVIGDNTRFSHQIYRVFGGNNLMDMDIQPTWDLRRGYLFSVYSGGNFGKMTYPEGLSLTINSDDIHIESVYGGGRVGDIDATDEDGNRIEFANDKYGATLNIEKGIIGDVYGGNNVAGNVYNGTNVNISGAISGNVYGSGNGNYIYYYDHEGTNGDPANPGMISEGYNKDNGGRYFILPKKVAYYNGTTPVYYGDSDEEKLLAINSYRPNVEKAFLNIQGTPTSQVFVLGNVYCGGNSSTVLYNPTQENGGNIKFEIGSYVTLGGVFLGSNGKGLAAPFNITYLTNLNGIDNLAATNSIASRTGFGDKTKLKYNDQLSYDTSLYPNLLTLYMRAAEVTALPTNFSLPPNTVNAYIGDFCLGGNYGSMMTDKPINIELPEALTIFGRIVGGCHNSRMEFGFDENRAVALGGMTKPLAGSATDKVNLTIKSKFRPWRLLYDENLHKVNLVNDRTDINGKYISDAEAAMNPGTTYYYREGLCDIFGGCYTSGKTVGNINIDLYSDVLGYYENGENWNAKETGTNGRRLTVDRDLLMNNVTLRRTVYALVGAGYGPDSEVEGNIRIRLLPTPSAEIPTGKKKHPSIATIFGGAHDGKDIGNSTTEIRDGMVFSNLYGGSRAAYKYGSSEIIVGYPKYYKVKTGKSSRFTLNRADQYSYVAQAKDEEGGTLTLNQEQFYNSFNHDGTDVIKQNVKYREGEIVAANVFEQIADANKESYFDEVNVLPTNFATTWDYIDINIGDNSQMNTPGAHFYGGGGIYGGGHAINESAISYSGINTQLAYDAKNNLDNSATSSSIGYGGNSTIIIGDNPNETKDHIAIGTGQYVEVKLNPSKDDKKGTYALIEGKFVHQSAGAPQTGVKYYEMKADGGVFGDGRRTFVQNFRAVDITGYGYNDYTPQSAKLINTFQRIDLLSLNDCCLQLQGTQDYATNTIDMTRYSIARVGEIRMNSSLTGNLEPSETDEFNTGNMSLNKKKSRNYMGFFNSVHYIGALYSNTSFDSSYRSNTGVKETSRTYKSVKKGFITDYESNHNETAFKPRNLGTAPNMIGINNGYTLKVQNAFTTPPAGVTDTETILSIAPKDNIYYGPIVGVVEVKLLTVQADEGGGYIYAFNHHEDNATKTGKTFLEDTGNFVFASGIPGGSEEVNYIIDDCYPLGFYGADGTPTNHATTEEVHYWFVQGHKYFFNTTLTGYTYDKPIDFYLKNTDALILLSGITTDEASASTIEVESVNWRDHVDTDYKSALKDNLNTSGNDSRENYQLYLSIDANTNKKYDLTDYGNAFVAQIPNGNGSDACGTDNNGNIQYYNNYSDISTTVKNTPLIGIRLHDTDTNNNEPGFYNKHLSAEDYVVIKIKAKDTQGDWNYYTINLTIDYLQGPYIKGNVNIENCALPGEYIYANTEGITMRMDDNLTVTGKKWYLYPKQKRDNENTYYWDTSQKVDVTKHIQKNMVGDVNRLQLPARYYQNDWQLDFVVFVNGQEFKLNNSELEIPRLTVHNYHRMSTVAAAIKNFGGSHTDYGYDLDLDLVGGALVYIESDKDFEIFTKYVNYCNSYRTEIADNEKAEGYEYKTEGGVVWQKDKSSSSEHWARVMRAEVLQGHNRQGGVTGFKDNNAVLGHDDDQSVPLRNVKNPSGAENIRFVLTTDIETTPGCMPIEQFRGRLNGNGHVIHFKSGYQNKNFIDRNYGDIDYVGFASSGGADSEGHETAIVFDNYGRVNNCFYYNYLPPTGTESIDFGKVNDAVFISDKYASLVQNIRTETTGEEGKKVWWIGSVDNCYQNVDMKQANALHMDALRILNDIENGKIPEPRYPVHGILRYRSSQSFHNGMIAYNLNQEYLKARWKSHDNDDLVREQIVASHFDDNGNYIEGDYLYNYYADGDYRYAYVHDPVNHPEGLRLAATEDGWPNYEDYLGTGQSMHKSTEDATHDSRRWFTTNRNDLVQIDSRGQIIYDEIEENVDGISTKKMVPKLGNAGYFPLYLHASDNRLAAHSDFIFFGQRITTDKRYRQYFPNRINYDNRIYRASGTYGSRTDYGFHFNRDAEAIVPQTTAIDFTGSLDLVYKEGDEVDYAVEGKDYIGKPQYKERWQFYVKHGDNSSDYNNDKYYSYDKLAASYEQVNGEWTYRENLPRAATDTLIQLIFYPPLLDLPGGDIPENLHNIKSFKVNSNQDIDKYNNITKNLLVYTPAVSGVYESADEERLFGKFHYTRMHNWGDVEGETKQKDIIGHHLRWVDHKDDAGLSSHFHSANGLFHLVDQQDFNAPIDFYVADDVKSSHSTNGRAWMLRQPKGYSSRITQTDANGFTVSKDAWESIALPFTCNRVVAVNSGDYIEKYSRGQITHFYGNDPARGITHHDYWLRGLVKTTVDTSTGDVKADFARPGSDADGLFQVKGDINSDGTATDEQMRGDYVYSNNWFYTSYKDMAYNPNHNEYADTLQYLQYRYITKNAPYIIAFPGKDYYEFDLSGEFYNDRNSTNGCHPQEILYEFTVEQIDANNNFDSQTQSVRIPVTDVYNAVRTTTPPEVSGYKTSHHATFKRLSGTEITDNMYVLNDAPKTINGHEFPAGSVFIKCKDFNITEILPFRTYLMSTGPSSSAKPYIMIGDGTRSIDNINDQYEEEEEEQKTAYSGLNIYVQDNNLVITSDSDLTLPLYGVSGQLFRILQVKAGYNVYHGLHSGVYIALKKKFVIRR